MSLLLPLLIFFGIAVAGAMYGMKIYVRPKEAMDRVVGGAQSADEMPSHPSLAFHDLIKRLGNLVPQSPKDVTVMQRRLIRAGMRNESSLKILYGAKAVCGVVFPLIALAAVAGSDTDPSNKFVVVSARDRRRLLRTQRICAASKRVGAPETDRPRVA